MNDSDFLLFHTYADHVMDQRLDPRAAAEFLVEQGLCNGIMIWVDHHRKPVHPPSAEWLRRHDLALLFEFYTNDHYAVPCARREGFGDDLTAYNNHWCRLILDYLKALGPGRSFWGLGHEHYDSFCGFSLPDESGKIVATVPASRREGFETYRRWITTNAHQQHWGPQRYATLPGYRSGRMTDQPDTFEFLKQRGLNIPHGLIVGGVGPHHAHYQFEIFPEQEAFWWECMVPGLANAQVGMSFLRGAVRQYGRKGLADVAPYEGKRAWHDELMEQEPLADEFLHCLTWACYDENGRKLAGYSESLYLRVWMSLWAGGVDIMLHEDSISTHFNAFGAKTELSPLGRVHADFVRMALDEASDRGKMIPTAAVVLPFLHGLCPAPGVGHHPHPCSPWQGMPLTRGDRSIVRFFDAAFPNHGIGHPWPYPGNPYDKADVEARRHFGRMMQAGCDLRPLEPRHVTASRWGNGLDVLLDNASLDVLRHYPALILLGDFELPNLLLEHLGPYLEGGGRVLTSSAFAGLERLGFATKTGDAADEDNRVCKLAVGTGSLWVLRQDHLLEPDSDGDPEFPAWVVAVLDEFLEPHRVLEVQGPPIEWCAARNGTGLRLYLANHSPADALPILTVHPESLGCRVDTDKSIRNHVVQNDIPWRAVEGQSTFEVKLSAWGVALLDIPLKEESNG